MIYRLLTIALWPVFFIYTLKIALRDKSSRYFFQRLGFSYPARADKNIWIHCASVGEVNTYLPLHIELLKQFPDTQFVITTNTVTGASTVNRHKLERTRHCYLPVESAFAIKRFFKAWQPTQCLIMETELWPLLYQLCHINNISISIINARLSHRTLSANNWIKSLYKTSFSYVDNIICKSDIELNNFISLGASSTQLSTGGNLKFVHTHNEQTIKPIKLNNQPYCVAASTHNDEELQLARLWQKLNPDMLLVIVPRHPNRSSQIQKQLDSLNTRYAVRSQNQDIKADTKIYLADTLGELSNFMAGAEFVFIGGSLIKHGGQNILESARLGKLTLCGPHMFNFKDEVEFLLDNNACLQVKSINELEPVISGYFNKPENFVSIANNAKYALQKQSTILETYLSKIPEVK
ncbi:MAG: 3-deoxy-D-manno-octulosonic acid transferase [endosymbiont of Galathealinum brachiosum]|uniref:3-deoxy-D-manno-octulosonic acid transferase n=1 Tax=endosymbiont of Galathealinum brachiosum TaxID=2200906 RepID=A0A370D9D4_9GAMM|nr:MAG: 3-deoxy-D-manno-octulosonic acid transferase [endosymbiont of Galathealinum brachiosum]